MLRPLLRPLWHMGALHPFEQALTLLLAFGPFVVLGIVVRLRRTEDEAVAEGDPAAAESPSPTAQENDVSG